MTAETCVWCDQESQCVRDIQELIKSMNDRYFTLAEMIKHNWEATYRRDESLSKLLMELEVCDGLLKVERKPHKCPVCEGRRTILEAHRILNCESCEGKGIVWG